VEGPLVIGPFIESRGSNNRPQEKTADEAQEKDFHVAQCHQYPIDTAIAQSIAGGPIYAVRSAHDWRSVNTDRRSEIGGRKKE